MIQTSIDELKLEEPDPIRDAPFALGWFEAPHGRETLLLMGNADHEISTPSLAGEQATLREFIDLKAQGKQLTWMIRIDNQTIGAAWIDLLENHSVKSPSIHLMIGAKEYRGRGIGKATMSALIEYVQTHIETPAIYSRHLTTNSVVAAMNRSLGFANDDIPYADENGLEWQNVKLAIQPTHSNAISD